MNKHERAVKEGLEEVIRDMNKQAKIADLNKGFNEGVRRGKDWVMTLALITSFIAFSIVMAATLMTVGKVDGRSESQARYHQQQQKIMIDEMAMLKVEIDMAVKKIEREVNKK
jgi:hypothetical protein